MTDIRAARGTTLTARSWQTEAPMRMLMNNLDPEVAEHPEQLIVYGGTGKAARDWPSYHAIVRTLTDLRDDETLLVQSGRPVGVMRTHEWAPRVLIANSNLVGDWATWPEFRRLEAAGLTMYGQMTAGSWIYIGTQGILQGTYETFGAVAAKSFNGTLAGTITLTAGLGGMGGAQPLAVTMNDGVCVCIEVDQSRITRRIEHRYLDVQADDLAHAMRLAEDAKAQREPLSIGVLGNAADIVPELLAAGAPIDVVTDQTSAHDPLYYLPHDVAFEDWAAEREKDPAGFTERARASHGAALRGHGRLRRRRRRGVRLRQLAAGRGARGRLRARLRLPGLRPGLHPAAVLRGQGAVPVGRAVGRSRRHPRPPTRPCSSCSPTTTTCTAGSAPPRSGSRSRVCRRGSAGSATASARRPGMRFNDMVASGELSAPIVIGRDHLDCGSVASPYRETEAMLDGSDAIADWPLLNAMVNVASGATWVSIHHGGGVGIGRSIHAGQVCVVDGTPLAGQKAERVLTNDPGMGVIRHVDAGYDEAADVAEERGVRVPMREG